MTVKTKTVQIGKVNLCLPVFSAEETAEAELINSFYDSLSEKISAYVASSPHIRRYNVSFQVSEENGTLDVKLQLCARVLDDFGGVDLCKRDLLTRWRGAKLTVTQLQGS